jgi:hypothetical protein
MKAAKTSTFNRFCATKINFNGFDSRTLFPFCYYLFPLTGEVKEPSESFSGFALSPAQFYELINFY